MVKNSLYTDVSLFTDPLFSLLSPPLPPCARGHLIPRCLQSRALGGLSKENRGSVNRLS